MPGQDVSSRVDELMQEGLARYASGAVGDARQCFERVLDLEPGNIQVLRYIENIKAQEQYASDYWGVAAAGAVTMVAADRAGVVAAFVPSGGDQQAGDSVDLSAAAIRAASADSDQDLVHILQGARELYELDDFSGALQLFEKIVAQRPDHDEARRHVDQCIVTLIKMMESRLGDLRAIPRVVLSAEDIIWLNIDHRGGFVLARIDGVSSLDEVVELSGMDRLSTYRILIQLLEAGAIVLD